MSLSNDLKSLLDNPLFSDIKIKENDGKEISAHRNILVIRSEVFKRLILNEVKETNQDVIEILEFSSDILLVILEYLYSEKVTEKTLKIEILAKAFHSANFFLLEQLKLQIIEFFKIYLENNKENKVSISAKILSQLLESMESPDNKLANLLYDSVNSVPLKSIEYCNLNAKALEYILSKVKKEETKMFSTSEYDLLHYIILWAANEISEEAFSFYKSCLPSSEIVKSLNMTYKQEWGFNIPSNISESHAKYQLTMIAKTSSLFNYVNLEHIHPFVISNTIESFDGLINSKILLDVYRKQALLAGKYACLEDNVSLQWDNHARGNNMYLDKSPFVVTSKSSSSHEWIRTKVPISGQGIYEWDIVVEMSCKYFWVGICTENGFNVDYNSWLGKHEYGWVLSSGGFICHNREYTDKYGQPFKENDRVTVHLNMRERTCFFSINGIRYPIAFRNLPDEIFPAVSFRSPGRARIEPR
ncbi:concanavalin A-like lectin/glucanase domain-containing protein [Glomus cerebriforme]|uniref:Concanavalin A-like lectin/glucanase domain-containing protein n=1 Tax=Glomus cerebriforme TaxID=658196 RepID=A0A397TP73_9GLOM|nr:concanavalin A-like lectin/glucanase domain-containing protein [Glomus cerebriforme]